VSGDQDPGAHRHGAHDHGAHDHGAHEHGTHDHAHDDGHPHGPDGGWRDRVRHLVRPHSHDAADSVDDALETSRRGVRALLLSFLALMATAGLQAVVVAFTGSAALLSDTLHNVADALTAVPLAIAFTLGRRAATRRYTHGFGRAEDLAGVVVVVVIAASAAVAAYESVRRFAEPREIEFLAAVAVAGVVGALGNEWVARYRIRVGQSIGSAALVADGLHARTDAFTSLAVVVGAAGVAAGWEQADAAVGLLIAGLILLVLRDAAGQVLRRLLDGVDPETVDLAESVLRQTPGVRDVPALRLRWVGHQLRAEADVVVDADLPLREAHAIAVEAEHRLIHEVPRLTTAVLHVDPEDADHGPLDPHRPGPHR
jgi:cation diffusion facilitator family transporter